MRIKGKEDKRGECAQECEKMYDGVECREGAGEEKGRHALKASDTYIFKYTNCFQGPNAHQNQGEVLQNNLTLQLQTFDFGASTEAQNKCSRLDFLELQ